jgi:hypothetical protein
MNKLMDGIHIEEITEYELRHIHIKFEAKLTCPYASPGMWSPTALFRFTLEKCCKKHFKDSTYANLNYNNTNTTFWTEAENV